MQLRVCSTAFSTLLVLFVIQATHAQFMCYVCENCAKITADTPLLECNADFFNSGPTLQPTETTTVITTVPSTNPTTTTPTTTTVSETTTDPTTTTTTPGLPSPPTVGPVETTEAIPTPPNVGTVETIADDLDDMLSLSNTTAMMPTNVRGRRQANGDDYTYHCYTVKKEVNGTWEMERGCSRVTSMEDVCVVLEEANNGTKLSKCIPCTNTRCNSSTTLALSMLAMVLGVVVTSILNRQ